MCLLAFVQSVTVFGISHLLLNCATFCWKVEVGIGDVKIKVFLINHIPLWLIVIDLCFFYPVLVLHCPQTDIFSYIELPPYII